MANASALLSIVNRLHPRKKPKPGRYTATTSPTLIASPKHSNRPSQRRVHGRAKQCMNNALEENALGLMEAFTQHQRYSCIRPCFSRLKGGIDLFLFTQLLTAR